jgi:hypothetical protein
MIRRKSEITARMNERDYPHIVDLALPPGGFPERSDDMLAFHPSATFKSVAAKDGMTTANSMSDTLPIQHMPRRSKGHKSTLA